MNNEHTPSDVTLLSQSHILLDIEQFVNKIAASDKPAFSMRHDKYGQCIVRELPLGKYLAHMPRYLSFNTADHDFSEHIGAFWSACMTEGFKGKYGIGPMTIGLEAPTVMHLQAFNALIGRIREAVSAESFKRRASDRRYETKQKRKGLQIYVNALLAHHARLQVIRIDFNYLKATQRYITINDVYRHLDALIEEYYTHEVFKHAVGVVWCVEQGKTRGYHIHAVYFFLGTEVRDDWLKSLAIGGLWPVITNGMGAFHSCHGDTSEFKRRGTLGIGMIHRYKPEECFNAVEAACYLAKPEKDDQYLRMKPAGRRTYATGRLPDAEQKRGRPPTRI